MIQYFAEYRDTENVLHRFEIENDDFTGSATQVSGYVEHEYLEADDALEAIRGSALKIYLDASVNLTFEDLYSDQERTFKITYYRANQIKFVGFINPDGIFQDWVNDKWELSLDCSDGLGYLENLSYPDTSGRYNEITIISKCLKRTGLDLDFATHIPFRYKGQSLSTNVLSEVYQDAQRFKRDDEETPMSCKDVLLGVLEKYCASIFQRDGVWHIVTIPSLVSLIQNYYVYDSNGVFLRNESKGFNETIGSHINGYYPHHCGANQKIEIQPSVGAYRINYKYGFVAFLNENPEFENNGSTADGWNILKPNHARYNEDDQILIVDSTFDDEGVVVEASNVFTISEGTVLETLIRAKSETLGIGSPTERLRVRVTLTDGVDSYTLDGNGSWGSNNVIFFNVSPFAEQKISFISEPAPISGSVQLDILSSESPSAQFTSVEYSELKISVNNPNEDLQGEFFSFQRINNKSSVIRDNKTIAVGDNTSQLYTGALFKSDKINLTSGWDYPPYVGREILHIMGALTMKTFQKPAKIFEGDVYGFLEFPGTYDINTVPGDFIMLSYKYNTKTNIAKIKGVEIFSDYVSNDISVRKTYDYGDTSKPTID